MLFHEIIFNLLTELNSQKVLTKSDIQKFLSYLVRDGTDLKKNKLDLKNYLNSKNLYHDQKEESIEFICKFILKKALRLKNQDKIGKLKESTKSKD